MRVFVAGAAGAVGQHLVPQLVAKGHWVTGTSRSAAGAARVRELGAEPVVVDGLDGVAIGAAVARAEPEVIINEMTALTGMSLNPRAFDRTFAVTNQLRTNGNDHLLAAAAAAGVRRFIAQSFAGWPSIREGGPVKTEQDPLDPHPPAEQRQSLAAIEYLERVVPAAGLQGIVLRYGGLYGPGATDSMLDVVRARRFPIIGDGAGVWSFLHVSDAAAAAVAALERGEPGCYNIVDDEPAPVAVWLPYLAEVIGAPPPRRLPLWLGRLAAGETGVSMMTQIRGSSNAKAKQQLGWQPAWPSWREGFKRGLGTAVAVPGAA